MDNEGVAGALLMGLSEAFDYLSRELLLGYCQLKFFAELPLHY